METQMQNPKKKGKVGVIVAAILVLAVAGMAVWGGQSDWFQGYLGKVTPKMKVTKEIQKTDIVKNVVKDVADEPIIPVLPDKGPVTKLGLVEKVATVRDFVAPARVRSEAQDEVVYRFKVDQVGGLSKVTKLGFEVGGVKLESNNLDFRLWESKGGVKTEVGFLLSDLSFPSDFLYSTDAEYIVTADFPDSFAGKLLAVSLFADGVRIINSEKALEVVTSEIIN